MHGLRATPQLAGSECPDLTIDLRSEQRVELAATANPANARLLRCAWRPSMLSSDQRMLALGSCLAGLGILLTGLLALLFRNPAAPRWTRPELVATLICVPVTGMIGLGLGYTAYGLSQLVKGAGDPRELLVLLAVLIVLALAWRVLGFRRRLLDYAATGEVAPREYLTTLPTLATDEDPPPRPKPRAGSSRKAA